MGPAITFVNPTEGGYVDPTFDLMFDVTDNQSPQILDLLITLDDQPPIDAAAPVGPSFSFPVTSPLGEGPHTITVEATDEDGNATTEMIAFTVGTPPDGTGTDTDASTGGTDTDAGTAGGTDTDAATDGSSGGSSGSGGGCSVPNGAPGLALLLIPVFVRRRH